MATTARRNTGCHAMHSRREGRLHGPNDQIYRRPHSGRLESMPRPPQTPASDPLPASSAHGLLRRRSQSPHLQRALSPGLLQHAIASGVLWPTWRRSSLLCRCPAAASICGLTACSPWPTAARPVTSSASKEHTPYLVLGYVHTYVCVYLICQ